MNVKPNDPVAASGRTGGEWRAVVDVTQRIEVGGGVSVVAVLACGHEHVVSDAELQQLKRLDLRVTWRVPCGECIPQQEEG